MGKLVAIVRLSTVWAAFTEVEDAALASGFALLLHAAAVTARPASSAAAIRWRGRVAVVVKERAFLFSGG